MNDTLHLRLAGPEDAPALAAIYAPYVLNTAVTYEYVPPTPEEFARRIRGVLAKFPYLAAESDRGIIGCAYAAPFSGRRAGDWTVEESIYIRPDARRCGAGRLLLESLENILREQGVQCVTAKIATSECADDPYLTADSIAFHRRMGYADVGEYRKCGYKFGRWYGLMCMEKHIGSHAADMPDIKPLDEMRDLIARKYGIA